MEKIDLDIQPQASIYSIFTRLSYEERFALAEFVDNSTASYFIHKTELKENAKQDKLFVEVNYDEEADTITVIDDAFGMEIDDFKRAILLDAKPVKQGGRNEFGMGLKTAATWFGGKWSVESTSFGSRNKYKATIDLDTIVDNRLNHIDIEKDIVPETTHGTTIKIEKLNRNLKSKRTQKQITELLSSMYRRDLVTGNIEILFNGTPLEYSPLVPLTYDNKTWKKDISFSVEYRGKTYHASGFVGILENGSYQKSGFALFRRNRVVDTCFNPKDIFGAQNSPMNLRLYGELDMDEFEVNQAKDGFSWDSILQDLFIQNLKLNIMDYIQFSKKAKSKREGAPVENGTQANPENKIIPSQSIASTPPIYPEKPNSNEGTLIIKEDPSASTYDTSHISSSKEAFSFDFDGISYSVIWKENESNLFMYQFDLDKHELFINTRHEYLKTVQNFEKSSISRFILSYVLAENEAEQSLSAEGYISKSKLHNKLNSILGGIIGE